MPNLLEYHEDHKYLLESRKKKIEALKETVKDLTIDDTFFPALIQSGLLTSKIPSIYHGYGEKDGMFPIVHHRIHPKNPDKMIRSMSRGAARKYDAIYPHDELPFFFFLGSYEEKRKQLAAERKREYQEYLKKKYKLEDEKLKARLLNEINYPLDNYKALLKKKREEEKIYRERNDFDSPILEAEKESPEMNKKEASPKRSSSLIRKAESFSNLSTPTQQVDSWHGRNEIDETYHITPRHNLLCTPEERIKAAKYKEELQQQILEKRRMKKLQLEKERLEEQALEKKIQEQRKLMLEEYKHDQEVYREKSAHILKKPSYKSVVKPSQKNIGTSTSLEFVPHTEHHHHRLGEVRSPGYLQVKDINEGKKTEIEVRTSPMLNRMQSLEEMGDGDSIERPLTPVPPKTSDSNIDEGKKSGRVLSRLSKVRNQMQKDHIRMMENQKKVEQVK